MMHALEHIKLIIDHLFIALDVLLEYDLDGNLALRTICLSHNAISACTERFAHFIPRSVPDISTPGLDA